MTNKSNRNIYITSIASFFVLIAIFFLYNRTQYNLTHTLFLMMGIVGTLLIVTALRLKSPASEGSSTSDDTSAIVDVGGKVVAANKKAEEILRNCNEESF